MRVRAHRSAVVIGLVVALGWLVPPAPSAHASLGGERTAGGVRAAPELVSEEPCPESRFTCITLRVPRDHFAAAGGPTFDVTFGIQRATGENRKGVFVTVTGGPGTSGLASADSYTDVFDPRITRQYDIVFLDQRGVGLSEPLQCPDAVLAFYTLEPIPTVSPEQALAYADGAGAFVDACMAEAEVSADELPYYATRQAVEDLEAFREWLGADELHLYGESYGTQYAQTYAAAHPDRVAALFVDGPVDLTLDGFSYYEEQTREFDAVLEFVADACVDVPECRRDVVGRDPLAVYDELAARLAGSPERFEFVAADGEGERRRYSLGDLETAAAGYLYSNTDEMLLQRALAYASRGELLPLARLTYIGLGQDPETLAAIPDSTYSDAMYYAVECMDYAFGAGAPAERVAAYLAAGEAAEIADVRMGSIFYGDLPCANWPVQPATAERPAYLTDTPYPIFVLASTADPATPYAGARRIFEQAGDGYLIVQPGGPHIIFGRGNACPDDLITDFLVRGRRPVERETFCDEVGPDPYIPIPAAHIDDYAGALEAMVATDDELNYNPDYWNWDGLEPLAVGCLHGGSMRYTPFDDGYKIRLEDCAFSQGLALTGRATIDDTEGIFTLSATAPGDTQLLYMRDADGGLTVAGTWRGEPVSEAA